MPGWAAAGAIITRNLVESSQPQVLMTRGAGNRLSRAGGLANGIVAQRAACNQRRTVLFGGNTAILFGFYRDPAGLPVNFEDSLAIPGPSNPLED